MNPPLTFSQALTQLQLLTSQNDNFTFTSDELTQALQSAWNDTYVCTAVWDSSTSFSSSVWSYPVPSGVTQIRDLYYTRTTTDFPEVLSTSIYEIVNGNIQFKPEAIRWLMDGMIIYAKGLYKLQTTDSLTTDALVNYVLNLATERLLSNLLLKKTFVFLTNNTSVAEISAALKVVQGDVLRYKQALLREFESA